MKLEDSLRWQVSLSFLSLDLWEPYAKELWVGDLLGNTIRPKARTAFALTKSRGGLDLDPREGVYYSLEYLRTALGEATWNNLKMWQKAIFISSGSDRSDEVWWEWLSRRFTSSACAMKLPPEVLKQLAQCLAEVAEDYGVREVSLNALTSSDLSHWDAALFKDGYESFEAIVNQVSVISHRNSFRSSWKKHCTSQGDAFLHFLFEAALTFIKEYPGKHSLTTESLTFPSSWEI